MIRSERILVFIPMYNCERQIPRVLARFGSDACALFEEILVVDNRSTDASLKVAADALRSLEGPRRTLVQNCENYSLGGSHKVAFDYALEHGFDAVVVLHGDDQADINDIVARLHKGEHSNVECLLGARFMRKSVLEGYSALRTVGNVVFNVLFSMASLRYLPDLGSGLNLFRTSFLRSRFYLRFPDALLFPYFLTLQMIVAQASYRFFPITWRESDQRSNVQLTQHAIRLCAILTRYVIDRRNLLGEDHHPDKRYRSEKIEAFR